MRTVKFPVRGRYLFQIAHFREHSVERKVALEAAHVVEILESGHFEELVHVDAVFEE